MMRSRADEVTGPDSSILRAGIRLPRVSPGGVRGGRLPRVRFRLARGTEGAVWDRDAFALLTLLGAVTVGLLALGSALEAFLEGEGAHRSPPSVSVTAPALAAGVLAGSASTEKPDSIVPADSAAPTDAVGATDAAGPADAAGSAESAIATAAEEALPVAVLVNGALAGAAVVALALAGAVRRKDVS